MIRDKAKPIKQIENDQVIVTQWRFAPGAETGWHRHELDYIVVPEMDGDLLIESAQGSNTVNLKTAESYNRSKGVEHNVINANNFEFAFVEIELKPRS